MKNSLVQKSEGLQREQEWLRANDIADGYPIGLSTVWDWAKKGKLTPIKVSARVTVFSAKEVKNLFKYSITKFEEVTVGTKKIRRRKKSKVSKGYIPKTKKRAEVADSKRVADYIKENSKPEIEFEDYTSKRKRRKKLPPAKEGIMGANRKSTKGRKNV